MLRLRRWAGRKLVGGGGLGKGRSEEEWARGEENWKRKSVRDRERESNINKKCKRKKKSVKILFFLVLQFSVPELRPAPGASKLHSETRRRIWRPSRQHTLQRVDFLSFPILPPSRDPNALRCQHLVISNTTRDSTLLEIAYCADDRTCWFWCETEMWSYFSSVKWSSQEWQVQTYIRP